MFVVGWVFLGVLCIYVFLPGGGGGLVHFFGRGGGGGVGGGGAGVQDLGLGYRKFRI